MGIRILVVDDDPPVRRMLSRTLQAEGYEVEAAADGGRALVAVERSAPDLVVLDIAMPGLDGLTVCRRLRARGLTVPILLLTARDAVSDRVSGLDAGADDYLVKPFAAEELTARIRALSRRGQAAGDRLVAAGLSLELDRRVVVREGREIALTERESSVLALLMRHRRAVVTREQAIDQVWGGAATDNVVDRYVGYLRRKLGEPNPIETVRGRGFTLGA